jgi:hypothetical protein
MLRHITQMMVLVMSICIAEASEDYKQDMPRTVASSYSGKVVKGDQQARKLGCPTANIEIKERPQAGVYASTVDYDGKRYNAMGYTDERRPTVLEAHLFGFNEDMYGKDITVSLLHFIRAPVPYTTADKMRTLLLKDMQMCLVAYTEADQLERLPKKIGANWVAVNMGAQYLAPELSISVFAKYLRALKHYESQKVKDPQIPRPPLDYRAYLD